MEKKQIFKLELEVERKEEELSVLKERLFNEKYWFAKESLVGRCFMRKSSEDIFALKVLCVDTPSYGDRTMMYVEDIDINHTASHSHAQYFANAYSEYQALADMTEITEDEYNAIKVKGAEKILNSIRENHNAVNPIRENHDETGDMPNKATSDMSPAIGK